MRIDIALNERAFVHVNSKPTRYLAPGRHFVWSWFDKVEVQRFRTDSIVAELHPDQLTLVTPGDVETVTLGPYERAVVTRRGRAARWLVAGESTVWTVERILRSDQTSVPAITIDRLDVSGVETAPLRDDVKALAPASDYVETTAPWTRCLTPAGTRHGRPAGR
jgi:regulator of protease activity HflC (stomatin/prohibitin superfamily)